MDIFLVVIICSTLGAMFLWAMHVDQRRSWRHEHMEEEAVAAAHKKCLKEDKD